MKRFIILMLLLLSQISYSQWEKCNNGLFGEQILSIAIKGNNVFVATDDGIYLSTDDGNNWFKKHDSTLDASQLSYSISYNFFKKLLGNSNDIYDLWAQRYLFLCDAVYASDDMIFANIGFNHGGIFISTDNGDHWNNNSLPMATTCCFAKIDSNIFFGQYNFPIGGVWITTNMGKSWKTTLENTSVVALAQSGNTIFAGTLGKGIYATTDNGDSWIQKNNGLTTDTIISLSVNGKNIYAGSWNQGVFVSMDNGDSWHRRNDGLTNWTIRRIAVNGNNIFVGTWNGIFLSTDNGLTWIERNKGLTDKFILSLAINGNQLWAGTRKGLFLSTDMGASWLPKNNGLNEIDIMGLDTINNNILAASRTNGVFLSTNNGNNWIEKNEGLEDNSVYAIAHKDKNIFIGTPGRGVWLSTNMGDSWVPKNAGLTNRDIVTLAIKDDKTIFAGGNGIYLTTNNGETWAEKNTGLLNLIIWALAVKENIIFAGHSYNYINPTVYIDSRISISMNNGKSWIQYLDSPDMITINTFTTNKEKIFAGAYTGLWSSSDYGYSWQNIPVEPSPDSVVKYVEAISISGDNIFIAGISNKKNLPTDSSGNIKRAIVVSIDGGKSFFGGKSEGLPIGVDFSSLKIIGDYLFAGTDKGIYRAKISDLTNISNVKENKLTSGPFIFPNPARDFINTAAYIGGQYQIYDLLGSCVQTGLIETENINVASLPAGFYTIRFFKEGKQVVEKMMKE